MNGHMEFVGLAFFYKPKIMIFYFLVSQNFLVVFVNKHNWRNLGVAQT